ncbi:hypothetical protein A33M_1397 [Rhodovulum sp. PH10]|nr:hypothetical protein A33M_1397 [Rhodovulum sp. PH10]
MRPPGGRADCGSRKDHSGGEVKARLTIGGRGVAGDECQGAV